MMLAEALAARKDAILEVDALRDRLASLALRYEDQAAGDDPAELVAHLTSSLDRVESLTIRINQTNNGTRLAFDRREMSIMEAIAERLHLGDGVLPRGEGFGQQHQRTSGVQVHMIAMQTMSVKAWTS